MRVCCHRERVSIEGATLALARAEPRGRLHSAPRRLQLQRALGGRRPVDDVLYSEPRSAGSVRLCGTKDQPDTCHGACVPWMPDLYVVAGTAVLTLNVKLLKCPITVV